MRTGGTRSTAGRGGVGVRGAHTSPARNGEMSELIFIF